MKNRWESSYFKKSYIANSISDYYIYYVEGMFSFIINYYIFSKLISFKHQYWSWEDGWMTFGYIMILFIIITPANNATWSHSKSKIITCKFCATLFSRGKWKCAHIKYRDSASWMFIAPQRKADGKHPISFL